MSLGEVNELREVNETDLVDVGGAIAKWEHFPASAILHHGKPCCGVAREWIFSTDYSQLNGENPLTGPRWLRLKYKWGPSRWPISWCEAVRRKTLDCGALASMANEVFLMRGVKSYPAQFVQQYTEEATRHWRESWEGDDASDHWIKEDLIYHEGCAVVVREGEIRLWDASAGWWMNPKQFGGYGALVALRVFAPQADFSWGEHRVVPGRWQKIQIERQGLALASAAG